MKKIFIIICVILNLITISSFCKSKRKIQKKHKFSLTWKNGLFYPRNKILRNIKSSDSSYWTEGTINYALWKKLIIEANTSYCKRRGNAIHENVNSNDELLDRENRFTKIIISTVGFGFKYFFQPFNLFKLFIGSGIRAFFYKEKNASLYVNKIDQTTFGSMINSGIRFAPFKKNKNIKYNPLKKIFFDIFADYNWAKIKPNSIIYNYENFSGSFPSNNNNINIGGFIIGIGIGYKF